MLGPLYEFRSGCDLLPQRWKHMHVQCVFHIKKGVLDDDLPHTRPYTEYVDWILQLVQPTYQ